MVSNVLGSSPHSILVQLQQLKPTRLSEAAQEYIRHHLSRSNEATTYGQALVLLYQAYEHRLQQASMIAMGLNAVQAKKIRYKKDRLRLFKKHGIDFNALAGADAIHTLSLLVNALHYEGVVTAALANQFPYWKEGFAMVQLDKAYTKMAEQAELHYQALLDALIAQAGA